MKTLIATACLIILIQESVAPPPRRTGKESHDDKGKSEAQHSQGLEEMGIEYERYLKEVIDALESDGEFKRKLEEAKEADIRNGKIAHELEFVDHNVRSKLDEVKRAELERLRHLAQREYELENDIDVEHMKIRPPEHLDHENPHTFEINDLKKLIHKVTNDLNEADKKRREEFKEYEMQKEFENSEKLKHLEGKEKEDFEKLLKDNETKHKQHDPLHHPGSKQQLEEVWEKQDHMEHQEFNPKVFFQLHDLDGNGFWDQNEVKTLFVKELDKMYQAGAPEDDMRERAEEMERMREHVFREADKNQDQLISFQEFLDQTKQPEFERDPAWETVDEKPAYTHEEYMEFERRRQQEIQHMIQQGLIPPQPVYHYPPAYHDPQLQQQQQQQFPQGHHPQQFQQPGQPQQQHPGQFQQQQHPGVFQQPQHPGQFQPQYQGQFQQPQAYHGGNQQGHPQVQQQHFGDPNTIPLHPNALPGPVPQVGGHPNALPQGGEHPNAVPQRVEHTNTQHFQTGGQGVQNLPNQPYTNQEHPQVNHHPVAASQGKVEQANGGGHLSQDFNNTPKNDPPNGPPSQAQQQPAPSHVNIQTGNFAPEKSQTQNEVNNIPHPNSLGGGSQKA